MGSIQPNRVAIQALVSNPTPNPIPTNPLSNSNPCVVMTDRPNLVKQAIEAVLVEESVARMEKELESMEVAGDDDME